MQENNKSMRIKTALVIAGAYISYSIGAGFGSGVELMQFFGVHGARGFLGLAVTATLAIALVFVLAHDCRTYELSDMKYHVQALLREIPGSVNKMVCGNHHIRDCRRYDFRRR